MKNLKIILMIVSALLGDGGKAQDTLKFENLKEFTDFVTTDYRTNYPQVEFFKYKLITPTFNIYDFYKGTSNDSVSDAAKYMCMVNDLNISSFTVQPTINLNHVVRQVSSVIATERYPLSLAFIEYHTFKDSAVALNAIGFQSNQFVDNSPTNFFPFRKEHLFSSASLNQEFFDGTINFWLADSLILTNVPLDSLSDLKIDFDDGNGLVSLVPENNYNVTYSSSGTKLIEMEVTYKNVTYYSKSQIIVSSSSAPSAFATNCSNSSQVEPPDVQPTPITTNILGTTVSGEFAVWFGSGNNQIRKPYIICAGYNPGNLKRLLPGVLIAPVQTFNFLGVTVQLFSDIIFNGEIRGTFYESYNGMFNKRADGDEFCQFGAVNNNNLYLDRLRDEGYDIIILVNNNGSDITVNNAALLMQLIQDVNVQKFANGNGNGIGSFIENVVSGYSSGALSARLALALMEERFRNNQGPHHHTKLYVSFDSEHQGANMPLGLQHLIEWQGDFNRIVPAVPMGIGPNKHTADLINSIACNLAQGSMFSNLTDEIFRFNARANNGPHSRRTTLLNLFASITGNSSNGYPEFCRRVGVSQGSGPGTHVPYSAPDAFDTNLGFDAGTGTQVSFPSNCGGTYTWHMPNWGKHTKASWWSTNNSSGKVFDADTHIDLGFTFLPMICFNVPFFGCQCTGPFTISKNVQFSAHSVAKPSSPSNFDDAPASTIATHREIFSNSAYFFYNSVLASNNSFANVDDNLHALNPVGSALDLHDPNNGFAQAGHFVSAESLGLLITHKDISNNLIAQPKRRFGYPHLNYPSTRYQVTPFDGIYTIGNDNGSFNNNSKPDNQFHVENPQEFIGDYLARIEVAPIDLFLSDRTIGATASSFTVEFEARGKIIAGKNDFNNPTKTIYSISQFNNYLTPDGDFVVANTSTATFHSGGDIELHPGFQVNMGSSFDAFIQPFTFANNLFRTAPHANPSNGNGLATEDEEQTPLLGNSTKGASLKMYPNPSAGELFFSETESFTDLRVCDLNGKVLFEGKPENGKLELNQLENGLYLIQINSAGKEPLFFKWVIAK